MLTYSEAILFLKFGEDLRWEAWPTGNFIRFVDGDSPEIAGYAITDYAPTLEEVLGVKWRRA